MSTPNTSAILRALLLLCVVQVATAQHLTEQHIPVGAYPELVGVDVTVCTIVAVDPRERTITVQKDGSEQRFRVTDDTKIWLDRSRLAQPAVGGNLADVAPGLAAEIRSVGPEQPDAAYWVKVQITAAQ
ncbi:MAG TPA: hypothetical protein VKA43_09980 [Gammaproteobacteria bacterium]|nr:hypothetical protein [Gammaproteobacteria bacterium]